jgi:hypothetical protein
MQLRQVRQLELRLQGHVVQTGPGSGVNQTMIQGSTYYVVPWQNAWTQKVTGSGQIITAATNSCDPGNSTMGSYPITMIELDATAASPSQNVTAYVSVTAP